MNEADSKLQQQTLPRGYELDQANKAMAAQLAAMLTDRSLRRWCIEQAIAGNAGPSAIVTIAETIHDFVTENVIDLWARMQPNDEVLEGET